MAVYSSGDAIPLWVNKDATANAPTAAIKRVSDGVYLDFSDNSWGGGVTPSVTLTDATNQWSYSWDSTGLAATEAAAVIEYIVDGAVYTDELQLNFGGGSGPTAADIADAVWDEATADHTTNDTFGAFGKAVHSSTMTDFLGIENWDCTSTVTVTFTGTMGATGAISVVVADIDTSLLRSYPVLKDAVQVGVYNSGGWTTDAGFATSGVSYKDVLYINVTDSDFTEGEMTISLLDTNGAAISVTPIRIVPAGGSIRRVRRDGRCFSIVNAYLQARDVSVGENVDYAQVQQECEDALAAYGTAQTAQIPSAATIANNVWDEPTADHTATGSFGLEVQSGAVGTGGGLTDEQDALLRRIFHYLHQMFNRK